MASRPPIAAQRMLTMILDLFLVAAGVAIGVAAHATLAPLFAKAETAAETAVSEVKKDL
jgi:hypothetical protein